MCKGDEMKKRHNVSYWKVAMTLYKSFAFNGKQWQHTTDIAKEWWYDKAEELEKYYK